MAYGGYGKDIDPEYLKRLQRDGNIDAAIGLGSLGLSGVGTAVAGYGAYRAWQQQEAARAEEQRRYQEEQRVATQERRRRDEQQHMENQLRYGGYAREGDSGRRGAYAGYAARVGL